MQRFANLYLALDATTRRSGKIDALAAYFAAAPPADAAWALRILSGRKLMRALSTKLLRQWAAEAADLPLWMVDECYDHVGDLSETLSLIVPRPGPGLDESLAVVVEQRLLPLATASENEQHAAVRDVWSACTRVQRLLFHKLISGAFRVGVARKTVIDALAQASGVPAGVLTHRLMGDWPTTPEAYERLTNPNADDAQRSQPYPFFLASPLDVQPAALGDIADWQVEWKWDGVRGQLIRREGDVYLWSRGEELINEQFPELISAAQGLARDVVLDGELLAWEDERPLAFHYLQRRLNRKRVAPALFQDIPVIFMAYDLLELDGRNYCDASLDVRRAHLTETLAKQSSPLIHISQPLACNNWDQAAEWKTQSAAHGAEGVMLKQRSSAYGIGRRKGAWWKIKRDPYTVDAVLTAAQRGHGKRATLFTDYTFGVWNSGELVTIAKAYSGLNDDEIRVVDRFVRRNTTARRGPVSLVKPELVFELGFEGIQPSDRHRSGLALRFPRMLRQRRDKPASEADSLESLRVLLRSVECG